MREPREGPDGDRVRSFGLRVVEGALLRLTITLGDMPVEDAFHMALRPSEAGASIGTLLDDLFPDDASARATIKKRLDVRGNPDLPEMYDALADVFDGWRAGRCKLAILARDGQRVERRDSVDEHVRRPATESSSEPAAPVLHIVLRQTFDPIGYAVRQGYYAAEEELLAWVQDTVLLYLAASAGLEAPSHLETGPGSELAEVVRRLQASGLTAGGENRSALSLTDRGREHLRGLIEEAESYVDRFDIFSDVLLDPDGDAAEFGTGSGDDLRVAAYEWEGLNPVRLVSLLRLYDGTVVESASARREPIVDRTWIEELLAPVVDRRHVDDVELERIVDGGYTLLEEAEEAERRKEGQRAVLRQVRRD